ncbi:MAG: preprotein translocase subunit YajC [Halanaerobacter sp.]
MSSILGTVLPIVVVFGIFWFLVIRPQKQRQAERNDMLSELGVGDEIVTIGGIKGEITDINGDDLKLKVASDVEIKITRQSIGRLQQGDIETEEENK